MLERAEMSEDLNNLWWGRPSWSSYILLWVFVGILAIRGIVSMGMQAWSSVAFHLLAIFLLSSVAIVLRQTAHYRVTRKAVYRSLGFSGKSEQDFSMSSIASVSEKFGLLERMFGTGDVILHLKNGTQERLTGVKNPEIVSAKIRAIL